MITCLKCVCIKYVGKTTFYDKVQSFSFCCFSLSSKENVFQPRPYLRWRRFINTVFCNSINFLVHPFKSNISLPRIVSHGCTHNTTPCAKGSQHSVCTGTSMEPYCLPLWFMVDVTEHIASIPKHREVIYDWLPLSLRRQPGCEPPSDRG